MTPTRDRLDPLPGQIPILAPDALQVISVLAVRVVRLASRDRCARCRVRRVLYSINVGVLSTGTSFICGPCWGFRPDESIGTMSASAQTEASDGTD